jgi:hypothetical protein
MTAKFLGEITAEMVIGLKFYPGETAVVYDAINGYVNQPKRVVRLGYGAIGPYQPQDIGKRVYKVGSVQQVENDEQVQRRTGKTFEQRKAEGEAAMKAARKKYKGQPSINAQPIWSL